MQMASFVEALQSDLEQIAAVGDDATSAAASPAPSPAGLRGAAARATGSRASPAPERRTHDLLSTPLRPRRASDRRASAAPHAPAARPSRRPAMRHERFDTPGKLRLDLS